MNNKRRELSVETQQKILTMASEILHMHAGDTADRICQDWSGDNDKDPLAFFAAGELDDIAFNYELHNSDGKDYDPEWSGLGDEMVVSFAMSNELRVMAAHPQPAQKNTQTETIYLYINEFEFEYQIEYTYQPPVAAQLDCHPDNRTEGQEEEFNLIKLTRLGDDYTQMLQDDKIQELIIENIKEGWNE